MLTVHSRKKRLQVSSLLCRCCILLGLLFLMAALYGCKTVEGGNRINVQQGRGITYQEVDGGGWLTLFLNLKDAVGTEVALEVSSVEVKSGNSWITLNDKPQIIDSGKIGAGQILVARNGVLPGEYNSVRFTIQNASLRTEGKKNPLSLAQTTMEMELPAGLNLVAGDSHSLFVSWDVEKSLVDSQTFDAAMNASLQAIPLLSDLLFVACPDLDTIYVIRTDKNWVISSLGISGRPIFVYADLPRNRLYVLATDEYHIKVVDLTANRVVDKYYIRMDFPPLFMTVDPEVNFAFLLDEAGKSLVKVNLSNGAVENQVALTYRPRYANYLEDQRYLAVSPADENYVYLFNPDTLGPAGSVSVGTNPQGLLGLRNIVFVAESGANSVSAYDINNRTRRNTVDVGFSPIRLFLKNNQIYATNFASGSVTVMLPGQLNVSGDIHVGGKPLEITGAENRRWIYVGDTQKNGLHIIDPSSNRVAGFIDLATSPLGMAVID